jgi:hypothetical protein
MERSNELRFAIYDRDLLEVTEWLDQEYFSYVIERRFLRLCIVVDVRGDPGKAGRAYDIGYKVSEIERNAIVKNKKVV